MPKIYQYKGWTFFFYSNDHSPVHVHARKSGTVIKIEFENILPGVVNPKVSNPNRLTPAESNLLEDFCRTFYVGIEKKWKTFFEDGKKPKSEKIK